MTTETINDWVVKVGMDTKAVDKGAKRIEKRMAQLARTQKKLNMGMVGSPTQAKMGKITHSRAMNVLKGRKKIIASETSALRFRKGVIMAEMRLEKQVKSGRIRTAKQQKAYKQTKQSLATASASGSSVDFGRFGVQMAGLNKSIAANTVATKRNTGAFRSGAGRAVGAAVGAAGSAMAVGGIVSRGNERASIGLKMQGAFGEEARMRTEEISALSKKFGLPFETMANTLVRFSDTIDAPIGKIKELTQTVGVLGKAKGLNQVQLETLSRVISQTGAIGKMETEDARSLLESGIGIKKILAAGGFKGNLLERARNQDITDIEFFEALIKGTAATGALKIALKAAKNTESAMNRVSNSFGSFSNSILVWWEPVVVPFLNGIARSFDWLTEVINGGGLTGGLAAITSSILVLVPVLGALGIAFKVLLMPVKLMGAAILYVGLGVKALTLRLYALAAALAATAASKVVNGSKLGGKVGSMAKSAAGFVGVRALLGMAGPIGLAIAAGMAGYAGVKYLASDNVRAAGSPMGVPDTFAAQEGGKAGTVVNISPTINMNAAEGQPESESSRDAAEAAMDLIIMKLSGNNAITNM